MVEDNIPLVQVVMEYMLMEKMEELEINGKEEEGL